MGQPTVHTACVGRIYVNAPIVETFRPLHPPIEECVVEGSELFRSIAIDFKVRYQANHAVPLPRPFRKSWPAPQRRPLHAQAHSLLPVRSLRSLVWPVRPALV